MTKTIKIALPKGRMLEESLKLFALLGVEFPGIQETKKLTVPSADGAIDALIVRSQDVPTYVAQGAADLGVVGQDVLWESGELTDEIYDILDLGFGRCRLVVASPGGRRPDTPVWRVASKYPTLTERVFQQSGRPVEVIKLYGSVELAPQTGIADVIVDIVETGSTLKANRLEVIDEIATSTGRLIANRVSYAAKNKQISELIKRIEEQLL